MVDLNEKDGQGDAGAVGGGRGLDGGEISGWRLVALIGAPNSCGQECTEKEGNYDYKMVKLDMTLY